MKSEHYFNFVSFNSGTVQWYPTRYKHHFSSTIFSLMPTLVSLHQPSKLKVSCRPPNVFQPSAYEQFTLAFLPGSCYILAHVQMLHDLLTCYKYNLPKDFLVHNKHINHKIMYLKKNQNKLMSNRLNHSVNCSRWRSWYKKIINYTLKQMLL